MPIKFVCSRCGRTIIVVTRLSEMFMRGRPGRCPFCGAELRNVVRLEVR